VRGNETRLGQVMLNLLLNAAQALDGRDDAEIRIAVRTESDRAVVEVADNGPGIPDAHLPLIFTPFFTTKEVGRGTGLGLSISHGIVTALGGTIQAKNHAGSGAVLRVELPLATPHSRVEPQVEPRRLPSRRARVMVVDDERALAQAIGALLRTEHDVEVHTEPTGALRMLEESAEPFDMVLCDVLMPRLSGIELYVRIRAARPEYGDRFVFMTGGALDDGARMLIAESASPLVQKPFDIEQILALVRDRASQNGAPFSSHMGASRV
jgi:CheY-like chemotaxis protein